MLATMTADEFAAFKQHRNELAAASYRRKVARPLRSWRRHFSKRLPPSAEWHRQKLAVKMLHSAEKRAKQKGLEFTLEARDIVIPEFCPVLGIPILVAPRSERSGHWDHSPSLDRFDNAKGYIKGNVSVISVWANRLKCDAALDELEKVVAYMRKGHA